MYIFIVFLYIFIFDSFVFELWYLACFLFVFYLLMICGLPGFYISHFLREPALTAWETVSAASREIALSCQKSEYYN